MHSLPSNRRHILLALGWYDQQIHQGIAQFAQQVGWSLDTRAIRDGMMRWPLRTDGIIGLFTPLRPDLTDLVKKTDIPIVDMGSVMTNLKIPRVTTDNAIIGRMAAEYFLNRGFVHFASLNVINSPVSKQRCDAFKKAMERHDFHVENLNVCPTSSDASIFTNDVPIKLSKQLAGLPKPLAVLIPSDHMSSLIFEACDLADLAVPEQVAILGINNSILDCDFAPVPLSSVDANLQTLGYEAARLLADLLDGQPAPKQPILIPPLSIVTRMSTSIAAVPHIHVASALQFIWQNHHRPIDVEDVVAHVPMSRIGLYRAFKRHLGRSIADEIARQRIEHAQQLLTSTHKKIYEIATLCGFENPDTFGRTFIRITGQSARQYRIRQDQQRSAKT